MTERMSVEIPKSDRGDPLIQIALALANLKVSAYADAGGLLSNSELC
jgi:hypothetical protein